jgi:hypothetical protein
MITICAESSTPFKIPEGMQGRMRKLTDKRKTYLQSRKDQRVEGRRNAVKFITQELERSTDLYAERKDLEKDFLDFFFESKVDKFARPKLIKDSSEDEEN